MEKIYGDDFCQIIMNYILSYDSFHLQIFEKLKDLLTKNVLIHNIVRNPVKYFVENLLHLICKASLQ